MPSRWPWVSWCAGFESAIRIGPTPPGKTDWSNTTVFTTVLLVSQPSTSRWLQSSGTSADLEAITQLLFVHAILPSCIASSQSWIVSIMRVNTQDGFRAVCKKCTHNRGHSRNIQSRGILSDSRSRWGPSSFGLQTARDTYINIYIWCKRANGINWCETLHWPQEPVASKHHRLVCPPHLMACDASPSHSLNAKLKCSRHELTAR